MARDSGVLNEYTWTDSMSDCDGRASSDWKMTSAATAKDASDHSWDEIDTNGQNIWEFVTYFNERPENMINDACRNDQYYNPEPHNYRVTIDIAEAENKIDLYFSNPQPQDGDDESDNSLLNTSLDIIGGAGNKYVSIGATIIDYVMAGGGSSTAVTTEDMGSKYTFDIDLDGSYNDLPRVINGEANSVGVSLRVQNDYSSGSHGVKYIPEYTFAYTTPPYDANQCACKGSTFFVTNYKTTVPDFPPIFAYYDAV